MNGEDSSCGNQWKCLSGTSFEQTPREGGVTPGETWLASQWTGRRGSAPGVGQADWGSQHSAAVGATPVSLLCEVGAVVLVITGHPQAGCINSW